MTMKRVDKGWGHELWVHNDEKYCGKRMHFDRGKRCSVHYHRLKHETFYLESGRMRVRTCALEHLSRTLYVVGDARSNSLLFEERVMLPGDSIELPPLTVHQMLAEEDSVLFEFSTQHFDDDSYRLESGD